MVLGLINKKINEITMDIFVNNETSELESVILGIAIDKGTSRGINPMMRKHLANNTYPTEDNIYNEIKTFEDVLKGNGVEVLRPNNLSQVEQIFTRDIGFVIEDYFFISNMKHAVRAVELKGIQHTLDRIDRSKQIVIPEGIIIEGGDVILWNDFIFIGIGDRTTANAIPFIQNTFPNKNVFGFDIVVDQKSADNNILHLDCTFQPIGTDEAIIYHNGFEKHPKEILDLFPKDKLLEVTLDEKNRMFPNVFSISPNKIVVEQGFGRLKSGLIERGYEVFEVDYSETSKLGGLLRCSTLPLKRKENQTRNSGSLYP
ncbi:MAG: N-dimethylarginine dimethylaminohydrolase [Polaribacter sp.]|jgi:N-dimethylarginine dimethylaminohydrolase